MKDTVTCLSCDNENAFFNGVNYECPDCNSEWDLNGRSLSFDSDKEEENEVYNSLIKLNKPFFKLEHGQLYKCKVEFMYDGELEIEEVSIIPLAFDNDNDKNRLHVLIEGEKWRNKHPEAVKDFAKMDFIEIWNDGIHGYFEDSMKMPISIVCATTKEGTLIDDNSLYFDFIKINK